MSVFEEFDALDKKQAGHTQEADRFDRDMREAVRLLMQRREGRVFINWLIQGQDSRNIMRRVMEYMEALHV